MSDYTKANLFLGRYTHGPHSEYDTINERLQLEDVKIRYMLQLPSEHSFVDDNWENRRTYFNAPRWLIVEDGDFWPIMVRLNP